LSASDAAGAGLVLPRLPVSSLLLLVWLSGALAVASTLVIAARRVRRLEQNAPAFPEGVVLHMARQVARELQVRTPFRVLRGARNSMPMTWGAWRPVLLLPAGAERWPAARLLAVLRHELAHVARRDALTQLVGELACVLHWFDPLTWLAAKRQRIEREHACDDLVLSCGAAASAYAQELVNLARSLRAQRATSLAAMAMAKSAGLRDRLTAVLDEGRNRQQLTVRLAVRVALITALATLPVMALTPGAAAAPSPVGAANPRDEVTPTVAGTPDPVAERSADREPPLDTPGLPLATPTSVESVQHPRIRGVSPGRTAAAGPAAQLRTDADLIARVLRQAARHSLTDNDMAELLIVAAQSGALEVAEARTAYLEAAKSLESSYELRRSLQAAVATGKLDEPATGVVLEAARAIDSDYERAELLLQVLQANPLTAGLRASFLAALDGIQSSWEHGRVASALMRQTGR
jgi:beta-lactamase regulating signal transducer with metallopeptidase domain